MNVNVNLTERIFGPDIGTLKGKTTRKTPDRVKQDLVEIPPEILDANKELTWCIDLMFICGLPFLTGIFRDVKHRQSEPLENKTAPELYNSIDKVLRMANRAGFTITQINCDREFKPLMDKVSDDLDANMNYTATDEHVPEAERNNRVLSERCRSMFHSLPYSKMPKIMLRMMSMICARQLNLFPAKGGLSPYFSPHVIMGGQPLDYKKHCQVAFGAYVQANNENNPQNSNEPRALDCIYLRPLDNIQGGHELMDLKTGRLITRPRVWEVPITDLVIKAVEAMAEKQGIKGLKMQNRNKSRFYPSDWIAGVEYDDVDDNSLRDSITIRAE